MNIITIIAPLICVATLGFICTKSRWLSQSQLSALSQFTFSISIPCFLFYQMAKADLGKQLNLQLFASFYLPVLACYSLAWLTNYFLHKRQSITAKPAKHSASAVFALGSSYSNTIIVGLPVLIAAIGEGVVGIVFLVISFHSAMLFSLTTVLAAREDSLSSDFNWLKFFNKTFNNPLIISIFTGLAVNLLTVPIPEILSASLVLLGKPAISLALFTLGASLAFYRIRSELALINLACLLKLFILPCIVFFTSSYIFNLNHTTTTILVVLSACPTGVNAYLIAANHKQYQEVVAGTVVMSTLMSMITIPCWLLFL